MYIVYLYCVCVCVNALTAKDHKGEGFFSGCLVFFMCVCVFLREQHDDTALCPTDDDWAFFSPTVSKLPVSGLDRTACRTARVVCGSYSSFRLAPGILAWILREEKTHKKNTKFL